MSIDALATWDSTFAVLPSVLDGTWTTNISDWVDARVTAKAQVTGVTHATPPFTFDKGTFKTQLDALSLTLNQTTGATQFANAWATAVTSSTLATAIGDSVNPGTPPTLVWGAITSSVIDSSSITSAKNQLITDLTSAALAITFASSELPKFIRNAFLNLTCTIIGFDQSTPTPLALSISGSPLI